MLVITLAERSREVIEVLASIALASSIRSSSLMLGMWLWFMNPEGVE